MAITMKTRCHFETELAYYLKRHGEDHLVTIAMMDQLFTLYVDSNRYHDAVDMQLRSIAAKTRSFGLEHPWTRQSLQYLKAIQEHWDEYQRGNAFCSTTSGCEKTTSVQSTNEQRSLRQTSSIMSRQSLMEHERGIAPPPYDKEQQNATPSKDVMVEPPATPRVKWYKRLRIHFSCSVGLDPPHA